MHSIETIKKLNGEYPEEGEHIVYVKASEFVLLKEKAEKWDAHVRELRAAPLRKNQ